MFFGRENEGQAVARTDYWQSVQAQADMSTSLECRRSRALLSRMRRNIYSEGDAGRLSTSSSMGNAPWPRCAGTGI